MKKLLVLLATFIFLFPAESTSQSAFGNIGEQITLTGKAVNVKLGAMVVVNDSLSIWIDGLESWPEGYYSTEESKWVRVTGKLIEKYYLPVFISEDGKPYQTGIPVPKGTDLKKASHRYLLKDATWEIIDE